MRLLLKQAILIHDVGWSAWHLFPSGMPANVGLLSVIYAVLGSDLVWFVPFNAAAHATGAMMIYHIGPVLLPGKRGQLGGVIGGVAFLVFPSALHWYGQNHRDAFECAGMLMFVYVWLKMMSGQDFTRKIIFKYLCIAFSGALLFGFARFYYLPVVAVFVLISSCVAFVYFRFRYRQRISQRDFSYLGILMTVLLATFLLVLSSNTRMDVKTLSTNTIHGKDMRWDWVRTDSAPEDIDIVFERVAEMRVHSYNYGRISGAKSEIDGDIMPNSIGQVISYGPRAILVGLLAPFPTFWLEEVSAPRLIAAAETATWYVLSFGFLFLLWRRMSPQLMAGVLFSVLFIGVLAYVNPNIGTLYRQRYVFWMFLLLCGCVGWVDYLTDFFIKLSK